MERVYAELETEYPFLQSRDVEPYVFKPSWKYIVAMVLCLFVSCSGQIVIGNTIVNLVLPGVLWVVGMLMGIRLAWRWMNQDPVLVWFWKADEGHRLLQQGDQLAATLKIAQFTQRKALLLARPLDMMLDGLVEQEYLEAHGIPLATDFVEESIREVNKIFEKEISQLVRLQRDEIEKTIRQIGSF